MRFSTSTVWDDERRDPWRAVRLVRGCGHGEVRPFEAVLALDHLDRHVAGPEALHLHRARELLEALRDLRLDPLDGDRHGDVALEGTRVLDSLLHRIFLVGKKLVSDTNFADGNWCLTPAWTRPGAKGGTRTPMPFGAGT